MKAIITLKGLKPGDDLYIESTHTIIADDIDQAINDFIYEFRNINSFYKIKYMRKVLCDN